MSAVRGSRRAKVAANQRQLVTGSVLTTSSTNNVANGTGSGPGSLSQSPATTRQIVSTTVNNSSPKSTPVNSRPSGLVLRYKASLMVHEQRFNASDQEAEDLVLNPKYFPDVVVGDIIRIIPSNNAFHELDGTSSVLMQPTPTFLSPEHRANALFLEVKVLDSVKGSLQMSLSKHLADQFGLVSRMNVVIEVVNREIAFLDFIELSFKDQYISRGEMWRFREDMQSACVYTSQSVTIFGMQAQINELLVNGQIVASGVIGAKTKWIFRSRSARLSWLIQLSEEMWDISDDGEMYFEKVVNGLLKVILDQWNRLGTNHSLSVVLFARTVYHKSGKKEVINSQKTRHGSFSKHTPSTVSSDDNVFQSDHRNRLYQDFYKVIVDSQEIRKDSKQKDWDSLRIKLKKEINCFAARVGWGQIDEATGLRGFPSSASEGNVLEAMNLAINVYDKHYIDRDLKRTGLGVVVFTAGNGVLIVDQNLAKLTKQRMADNGVGCDIISVSRPPIHAAPLFIFKNAAVSEFPLKLNTDEFSSRAYEVPFEWMIMKYYDYQYNNTDAGTTLPLSSRLMSMRNMNQPFVPLSFCKIFSQEEEFSKHFSAVLEDNQSGTAVIPREVMTHEDAWPKMEANFFAEYDSQVFKVSKPISNLELKMNTPFGDRVFRNTPKNGSRSLGSSPKGRIKLPLISPPVELPPLAPKLTIDIKESLDTVTDLPSIKTLADQTDDPFTRSAYRRYLQLFPKSFSPSERKEVCQVHEIGWRALPDDSDEDELLHCDWDTPLVSAIGDTPFSPTDTQGAKRYQKTFQLDGGSDMQVVVESTLMESNVEDPAGEEEGVSIVSPFKSLTAPLAPASNRRRWSHLLPVFDGEGQEELNMKSLSIPAILPLTCDYFPSASERTKNFVNYFYTLSVQDSGVSPEFLLKDLITQRLAQDFQQVLIGMRTLPYSASNLSALATAVPETNILKFHLSMADECHIIEYDSSLGNIEVQRYVRRGRTKNTTHQQVKIPYRYFLWNDYVKKFYPVDMEIASHHHDYNWNYVDQLLCGFHDSFLPNMKQRRRRYAIIPPVDRSEEKSEEPVLEKKLAEFLLFVTGKKVTEQLKLKMERQCRLLREFDKERPMNSFDDDTARSRQGFGLIGAKTIMHKVHVQSPRKDRQEWVIIQTDEHYSSDSCFHFEVHWLAASGYAVEQFLQEVLRKAKSLGLSVVQIPADHPLRSSDPFHLGIKFPILSPSLSHIAQEHLMQRFEFLPDGAESPVHQYLHRQGIALVRELSDGLLWLSNTLSSSEGNKKQCMSLFRSFRKDCAKFLQQDIN